MPPIQARNPPHALNRLGTPEFADYPTKAGTPATVEGGLDMNGIAFDQFLAQVVDLLCAVCADYAQSL